MFENPKIDPNIIEIGQVVPELWHFMYFLWGDGGHLGFRGNFGSKKMLPKIFRYFIP